ncbi:deoxynucleoside kinase [Brachybacterium sp. UMB0905]|uniref:deoxynucleoside kinase n=1 Tax=Brachybacterium sp. UMB0905 TaxID=2069310 RepID=UPI001E32A6CB|nr:deoxynucleoside kinase [Brachybacterium sp. UMB0905]
MVQEMFIAVEGPIGVGKTSLMHAVSERWGLREQPEIVGENPFFAEFYSDIQKWSFQTEMFFLTSRYTQLRDLRGRSAGVVSDYNIHKNLIFARRTLGPEELAKLEAVYDILVDGLPQPDLTVILDAQLPVLRRRIERRGRETEHLITDRYLLDLREDYHDYAASLREKGLRSVEIDTTTMDFVSRPADLESILETVRAAAELGQHRLDLTGRKGADDDTADAPQAMQRSGEEER